MPVAPRFMLRKLGTLTLTAVLALFASSGCTEPGADPGGPSCDGEEAVLESVGTISSAVSSVSCGERQDTGYKDGSSFPITVVTVDAKPVEVETANAYMVMAEAAARDGVQIRVVSGFRTQSEQQYLYNCYRNCSCNSCNLAARPGYSNHQSGHALDLNTSAGGVLTWLNNNGGRFGFRRTVPSEAWHWEWWGGGPGGGPCGRQEPPPAEECPKLGAEGGVIEETSGCFFAKGPSTYWRKVTDAGHGNKLMWTNAFQADSPSNWGRWYTPMRAAGRYGVEVWAEPGYAKYSATRYVLEHAGAKKTIIVDFTGKSGWVSLGVFDFAAGGGQHLSVYDNYTAAVPEGQRIPADAIRLVVPPPDQPAPEPAPPPEPAPAPEPAPEEPGPDPVDEPGEQPAPGGEPAPGTVPDPDLDPGAILDDGAAPGMPRKGAPVIPAPEMETDPAARTAMPPAPVEDLTGGCSTALGPAPAGAALPWLLGPAGLLALLLRRRRRPSRRP